MAAPATIVDRNRWGAMDVPFERFRTYPRTGAPAASSCVRAADTACGSAVSVSTRTVPSAWAPSSGVTDDHVTGGTSMMTRSACSDTTSKASATRIPERSEVSTIVSPEGSMGKLAPSSSFHIRVASERLARPVATSESPGERPDDRNRPIPFWDGSASTSITLRPALEAAMARFKATRDDPWPGPGELTSRMRPVVCPSISRRMPVNRWAISSSVRAGAGPPWSSGTAPRYAVPSRADPRSGPPDRRRRMCQVAAPATPATTAATTTAVFVSRIRSDT